MRNFLVMVRATSRHHKGTGELDACQTVVVTNHHVSLVPKPETTRRSPCQQSCDGIT